MVADYCARVPDYPVPRRRQSNPAHLAFNVRHTCSCVTSGVFPLDCSVRAGVRAVHAAQAAGQVLDAADAFAGADPAGGVEDLAGGLASLAAALASCFLAGTPLLVPGGSRPVEQFRAGDLVLSKNEHDPEGVIEAKVVEEVFVRYGKVLYLTVGGQRIGTTSEHPFWVVGKGWLQAG